MNKYDDFQKVVDEALMNAKENGYTFKGMTTLEIATDMVEYCCPLDDSTGSEIEYFVIDFFKRNSA